MDGGFSYGKSRVVVANENLIATIPKIVDKM